MDAPAFWEGACLKHGKSNTGLWQSPHAKPNGHAALCQLRLEGGRSQNGNVESRRKREQVAVSGNEGVG